MCVRAVNIANQNGKDTRKKITAYKNRRPINFTLIRFILLYWMFHTHTRTHVYSTHTHGRHIVRPTLHASLIFHESFTTSLFHCYRLRIHILYTRTHVYVFYFAIPPIYVERSLWQYFILHACILFAHMAIKLADAYTRPVCERKQG